MRRDDEKMEEPELYAGVNRNNKKNGMPRKLDGADNNNHHTNSSSMGISHQNEIPNISTHSEKHNKKIIIEFESDKPKKNKAKKNQSPNISNPGNTSILGKKRKSPEESAKIKDDFCENNTEGDLVVLIDNSDNYEIYYDEEKKEYAVKEVTKQSNQDSIENIQNNVNNISNDSSNGSNDRINNNPDLRSSNDFLDQNNGGLDYYQRIEINESELLHKTYEYNNSYRDYMIYDEKMAFKKLNELYYNP